MKPSKKRFFYPVYKKVIRQMGRIYKNPIKPGTDMQYEAAINEMMRQLAFHINQYYPASNHACLSHIAWQKAKWRHKS